jgi:type VII secretion protein EccB
MKSRRDQVHAHTYMVGRLTSALWHAEPDAPETPLRRTLTGSFGGLALGALAVGAIIVWGLIFGGVSSASSLSSGTLVEAKETGSRYIYAGGQLSPVLNWSSARLLLRGAPTIQVMSQAALADLPQGRPLGIPGAPDTLPATVNQGGWLACSGPAAGHSGPRVTLAIGMPAAGTALPGNGALLVTGGQGSTYLLWQGHRLRIDASWIPDALGLGSAQVTQVSPVWLNAVPAGPDLRPLSVGGLGGAGPVVGGQPTRVGQVLAVLNVGSHDSFYLAGTGGVSSITSTQAALELTDPATAAAYHGAAVSPIQVTPAAIAAAPASHMDLPDGAGAPAAPPAAQAQAPGQAPCVYYTGGTATPQPRLVFATPPEGSPPGAAALEVTLTPEVADRIAVAPGGGALVRAQPAPGVNGQSLFLVTSTGVKYLVPSSSAATALGYPASSAETLPAPLLGLLPAGPALNLAPLQTAGLTATAGG